MTFRRPASFWLLLPLAQLCSQVGSFLMSKCTAVCVPHLEHDPLLSCTGIRGGLFTVAMTRLNVRIRTSLFDALMRQEIAFFTSTKTGRRSSLHAMSS